MTRGGSWQMCSQAAAWQDRTGPERDGHTSACCSALVSPRKAGRLCCLSRWTILLEGDLAGGNSSDKCLPSYSICSAAVMQVRKDIFWKFVGCKYGQKGIFVVAKSEVHWGHLSVFSNQEFFLRKNTVKQMQFFFFNGMADAMVRL